MRPTPAVSPRGIYSRVAWSRDGQLLYAGGRYEDSSGIYPILQWSQAGRGPVTRLPAATDTIMDLRALADGRLVFGAQRSRLRGLRCAGRQDADAGTGTGGLPQVIMPTSVLSHDGSRRRVRL